MNKPNPPVIQKAGVEDLDDLQAVMDRANQYAFDKSGDYQWHLMPHARGQLRTQLEHGDCFVIRDDQGLITAAVTLTEEDTYMWAEEGSDGQALYFHKLMKDPDNSLPNTGLILLSFAAQETIKRNRKFLRCDAKPVMEKLIDYYLKLGFKEKRSATYPATGLEGVLLEANPLELTKNIKALRGAHNG